MKPNIAGYKRKLEVKKVTLGDLEATYCCMTELPPGVSWAEALPESREWFKTNLHYEQVYK